MESQLEDRLRGLKYEHCEDVVWLSSRVPMIQIDAETHGINPCRAIDQVIKYDNDPGKAYTRVLTCGHGGRGALTNG